MAGSYDHCANDDGSFRCEDFTDMIENLGDAHEACEMMHWMINYLADGHRGCVEEAEKAYYRSRGAGRQRVDEKGIAKSWQTKIAETLSVGNILDCSEIFAGGVWEHMAIVTELGEIYGRAECNDLVLRLRKKGDGWYFDNIATQKGTPVKGITVKEIIVDAGEAEKAHCPIPQAGHPLTKESRERHESFVDIPNIADIFEGSDLQVAFIKGSISTSIGGRVYVTRPMFFRSVDHMLHFLRGSIIMVSGATMNPNGEIRLHFARISS